MGGFQYAIPCLAGMQASDLKKKLTNEKYNPND